MNSSALFNKPLQPPPPGVLPNQFNPQTRGRDLTTICSIFLAFMIILVAIRAYTKLWIMRKLAWDDLTCFIGFLLTLTFYALCVRNILDGYVRYHLWDVTTGQVATSDFYMIFYAQELVCPLALGFIKLSYFILYSQVFELLPKMKLPIWIGATGSTLFYAVIFALNAYFAIPSSGEAILAHHFKNVDKSAVQLSVPCSAIGLALDLYIIILPIYGHLQLQFSARKKFSISLVFLVGTFACVSAMLTLVYRIELQATNDLLRLLVPTLMSSLLEMMIGVICTCAPSFAKTLHEHLAPYDILKSRLQSPFRFIGHILPKCAMQQYSSAYQRRDLERSSGDHISYTDILTGGEIAGDRGHGLHDGSSVRTSIGGGLGGFAKEDGIHLKIEILQERVAIMASHQGEKGTWTPTTAMEAIDIV